MPRRKKLPHAQPEWLNDSDSIIYFVTVCLDRKAEQKPLTNAGNSEKVLGSIRYLHNQQTWHCHLALLMPDHLHTLMSPGKKSLKEGIDHWKQYTSRQFGITWQRDYFDHRLRQEESLRNKTDYILHNPVRSGLVEKAEDWPHVWVAE